MDKLSMICEALEHASDEEAQAITRQYLAEDQRNYKLLKRAALSLGSHYEKSVAVLKELLRHCQEDAETHLDIAGFYWLMGEDQLVEQHSKAALALNPRLARAYGLLASVYETRGEGPGTIESMLRKAEELEPERWYRHSNLGRFYRQQGRIREAIDEILAALSCPDLPEDKRRRLRTDLQDLDKARGS